ncbi:MAG: hypothetical protein ACJ8FY_08795 [Gemmataceae bacterium]
MSRLATVFASLFFIPFFTSPAQAEFIKWGYDWTRSPITVSADKGGTGGITLTVQPMAQASGTSDIVAVNLGTFSSAASAAPDRFTNQAYKLMLAITDLSNQLSGSVSFSGVFNGTVSVATANIANHFTGPQTQVLKLGKDTYTVTIGPYAAPGNPDSVMLGSIGAHVALQTDSGTTGGGSGGGGTGNGGGGSGTPQGREAPEPTGIVIAGMGASFTGLAAWLRRRKASV